MGFLSPRFCAWLWQLERLSRNVSPGLCPLGWRSWYHVGSHGTAHICSKGGSSVSFHGAMAGCGALTFDEIGLQSYVGLYMLFSCLWFFDIHACRCPKWAIKVLLSLGRYACWLSSSKSMENLMKFIISGVSLWQHSRPRISPRTGSHFLGYVCRLQGMSVICAVCGAAWTSF